MLGNVTHSIVASWNGIFLPPKTCYDYRYAFRNMSSIQHHIRFSIYYPKERINLPPIVVEINLL